ncbi:MAG: hypothetical protein ACLQDM_06695 [Bradyrhizobium sp.]|jgi:hypothetical protein
MGGGGGGGGFSPSDAAQVQKAAEARLKNIASKSTKVLFICETIDRKSLESHLEQSKMFPKSRTMVIDGGKANTVDAALDSTTFLVPFTDETKTSFFIDGVIDKALEKKVGGVHVKAQPKSFVPAKVSAYRWRSLSWEELEAIFSS